VTAPRAVHDPGKILTDLVAVLALDEDCLADTAVLRVQGLSWSTGAVIR
jgi:hypothetical protein